MHKVYLETVNVHSFCSRSLDRYDELVLKIRGQMDFIRKKCVSAFRDVLKQKPLIENFYMLDHVVKHIES